MGKMLDIQLIVDGKCPCCSAVMTKEGEQSLFCKACDFYFLIPAKNSYLVRMMEDGKLP